MDNELFYTEPFVTIAYLDSWYVQNLSIFKNSRHSKYRESAKYSLHRTLCNLSIWATGLWITRPIIDIWHNFEYDLWVKRKEKYLYIPKCNNITNNSQRQNSGKYRLVQSYKYLNWSMVIFYQIKKVQFQKLKELRNYNRKLFLFLPQK